MPRILRQISPAAQTLTQRPRWLGYTLGYEIVGNWLDRVGEVDGPT
jgi:uncharacterized protein YjaZ